MTDIDWTKQVMDDEDGDRWWVRGHLDRHDAITAIKGFLEQVGEPADIAELDFDNPFLVSHIWFYDDGTDNDDSYKVCESGHAGAEPWTWVVL